MFKSDPSKNNLTVCENVATLSKDSTAETAKLVLPAVSTVYSDTSFGIQTLHNLKPFKLSSTGTTHDMLFDGDLFSMHTDNTADCKIDMEFREGYIGILEKVKYYLAVNRNKATYYVNRLTF